MVITWLNSAHFLLGSLLLGTVKFCLSSHYNGVNSHRLGNSVEIYKFKAKDSEINAAPFC